VDWLDIKEFFKDAFKYIIIVMIIFFIAIYVVGLQQVVGDSMNPKLKNNDVLILDKIIYKVSKIKRGDIVALYYSDTKYLIKRVVGLPGEKIEFKNNKLYINGTIIEEDYLNDTYTENFSLEQLGYDKIPADFYFVLGDNRTNSLDSRDSKVGLITKKDIIGKIRLRIWPLNKIRFF